MATKEELHARLANISDTAIITTDEFISVYGNDTARNHRFLHGREEATRADLYAQVYDLNLNKDGDNYIFTKV